MRNPDEVQAKIRTLLLEALDARIAEASRRLPHQCEHNHRQVLDPRKEIAGESNEGYNRLDRHRLPLAPTIGLCMLGSETPETWQGNICDEPIDAQQCPYFSSTQTKESVLADFQAQISDLAWLEENLPRVYELVWVLEETKANFQMPWWKRWWFALLQMRVEPVHTNVAPLLLDEPKDGVHGA